MKKILFFITILIAASVLLCGCMEYAFTTSSDKKYKSFADSRRSPGLDKEEVLAKCGYPRSFTDADGERKQVDVSDKEASKGELLGAGESVWVYECYQRPDPANPYRLTITFGTEGKAEVITFSIVGGG